MVSTGFDRHLSSKVIILLARLLLREMSDDFTSKGSQGRELFVLSSISSALLQIQRDFTDYENLEVDFP